ncbi:hypothetical protein J1N35_031450 [Gossypium stocksii]|uniref:Uncharacterized protein n=1 Tax=Gossypium stocksii TaxID=47602 RepID=A0A9D3V1T2_9ROSI|nr:hypothetical protein J1N35_031450 [Gossypium stocksii]
MEDTKMEDSSNQREMSHEEMPETHSKGGLITMPFIIEEKSICRAFFNTGPACSPGAILFERWGGEQLGF